MLQIELIYHFLFNNLFKDFKFSHLSNGVPSLDKIKTMSDLAIYEKKEGVENVILFYDQEPLSDLIKPYIEILSGGNKELYPLLTLASSEKSADVYQLCKEHNFSSLYYFFHGFAALDWFRGYHALNYNKQVDIHYEKDFITFNRTITGNRAYRKTFVDQLRVNNLLDKGFVSYGVGDEDIGEERSVIDGDYIPASASAWIPQTVQRVDFNNDTPNYDAFWHIVTETVFHYPKLHLTEKIFKPIVNKQPFMLLAAPGNLQYLRSYGFKTFGDVIDESYDLIEDGDARIDAVVAQMKWYCNLPQEEKSRVIEHLAPIVEYNFQHFYGKFREIITDELLDNTKKLFREIGYDDSGVDYDTVRKLLTS